MRDQKFPSLGAILLAVGLNISSLLSAKAQAAETVTGEIDRWSIDVVPYLWVANLNVETSLPSRPSNVEHFDQSISAGALFAAQARYRSVGIFMDFAWLRLDTEATSQDPNFSSVALQSDFIRTTLALMYFLRPQGALQVELLAGARIWNVNEDFQFQNGGQPVSASDSNKMWADPVIGTALRYELSSHWFVPIKGMVGGFGVSSDLAWEIFCGIGYRFARWGSTTVGYRYLHEAYSQDGFSMNMNVRGVLIGFDFHF